MKNDNHNTRAPLLLLAVAAAAAAPLVAACSTTDADCTAVSSYADTSAFAKCTACHATTLSGAARQAAPTDINYDTYAAATAGAQEALREIDTGSMPPAGSDALTDAEKAEIINWASCGTPE